MGNADECPTCPRCQACNEQLVVEQNVVQTFASKVALTLTGYVYHLTAVYDPVTNVRTATNTWLPANYNPALGGGQMDYSALRGRSIVVSARAAPPGEDETASSSDGEYAVVAYPNPAQNQLTLRLPPTAANAPATVTVTTLTGQTVHVASVPAGPGEPTLTLTVGDLPEGVYFYRVVTAAGSYCGKFLKASQP